MLSSRSTNALFAPNRENTFSSSSTRHLDFKTPAQPLKRGRTVHNENTVYGHPTGHIARKKASVLLSTPASDIMQPRLKSDKISRTAGKPSALLEITNQTPYYKPQFPVTPGRTSAQPYKLFTVLNEASEGSLARRVSSTRKKLRLPTSASKVFQTPDTQGNHWDVSDVSIEASVIEEADIMEQDHDDVEYGPPTVIDFVYEPLFDMPNYKEVGPILMFLLRQPTIPDEFDPVVAFDHTFLLAEDEPLGWEKLELPNIPLDNIFPSIVQSDNTHTSTIKKCPQSRTTHPSPPTMCTGVATAAPPMRRSSSTDRKLDNVLVNPMLRPLPEKVSTLSHTRIPSLSRPAITTIPPAIQARNRTALGLKTANTSHTRAISTPQAQTTSSTNTGHSRTGNVTMAHSRTSSMSGTISRRKWTLGVRSQTPKLPDDTVHSLLAGTGEELLGDEFLFAV